MKELTTAQRDAMVEQAYQTEVCTCTMPRKLHSDTFARGHGPLLGHGTAEKRIYCPKYTWDGKSGPFASK